MKPPTGTGSAPVCEVLRLPHRCEAAALARARVRASLVAAGVEGQCLDDAGLVVTELLSNAVQHARPISGGLLVLGWQVDDDQVEIRVTDGGSAQAVEPTAASSMAVCGRGLNIVERLVASWGVTDHVGGLRTVWAVLPKTGGGTLWLVR